MKWKYKKDDRLTTMELKLKLKVGQFIVYKVMKIY